MKLNSLPNIHDKLVINVAGNKVDVDICNILDTTVAHGKPYSNQPNLKHMKYICIDERGNEYQFIVFKDMTISNIHKIKRED